MTAEIIATLVAAVLLVVGCLGVIVPVLPGSILVVVGLLVWALTVQAAEGWVVLAVGSALAVAGMAASAVLTGARLKRRQIPNRSLLLAAAGAVVGLFVIPVVGIVVGFFAGLLLSETARRRDLRAALDASWAGLKAAGLGIVVEFACALAASTVFVLGALVFFVTASSA
ncbi:DUF456 domain-containing protein [Kocuria sp. M1R5S2]|uniref:DUF456 domain-containing protein n=1 Tax=Kocuria rhizosphaerae TaxID=3376285 RepID=UPI0037B27889